MIENYTSKPVPSVSTEPRDRVSPLCAIPVFCVPRVRRYSREEGGGAGLTVKEPIPAGLWGVDTEPRPPLPAR